MTRKPRCETGRAEVIQARVRREEVSEAESINVCKCRGQSGGPWVLGLFLNKSGSPGAGVESEGEGQEMRSEREGDGGGLA